MIFSKCCNRGLYCPFYFHNDCDILDVFSCRSFHVFKDFPGFKPAATQKVSNSLQHKTALIHLCILILLIKCSMGIYILGKFWNVILSLSLRHYCRIFSLSTGDHNCYNFQRGWWWLWEPRHYNILHVFKHFPE